MAARLGSPGTSNPIGRSCGLLPGSQLRLPADKPRRRKAQRPGAVPRDVWSANGEWLAPTKEKLRKWSARRSGASTKSTQKNRQRPTAKAKPEDASCGRARQMAGRAGAAERRTKNRCRRLVSRSEERRVGK